MVNTVKAATPRKRTQWLTVHYQQHKNFALRIPARSSMTRWMDAACERPTEVTVRFVDEDEGRELNATYRHKDYATNVLTFNYTEEPTVTADIVICVPVLERQAAEQGKTVREHMIHLLIHAILHAHGYDHLEEEEAEIMEARETELMLALGYPDPYSDKIGIVHD